MEQKARIESAWHCIGSWFFSFLMGLYRSVVPAAECRVAEILPVINRLRAVGCMK
jgi:hypothetical protein